MSTNLNLQLNSTSNSKTFLRGVKNAIPVGLAYVAVSFAIGVSALSKGFDSFVAVLMSMTNMTSAGQQAGILLILATGTIIELIITQLVINARYFLMSLSLTQRLDPKITLLERCLIAFGITDEVFAVSVSNNKGPINKWYMFGVELTAWFSWSFGTFLGVVVGDILPDFLVNALSIGIFAMFISIVFTATFNDIKILPVIVVSAALSCIIYYVPQLEFLNEISCVVCGVIASIFGAIFFPIKEEDESTEKVAVLEETSQQTVSKIPNFVRPYSKRHLRQHAKLCIHCASYKKHAKLRVTNIDNKKYAR